MKNPSTMMKPLLTLLAVLCTGATTYSQLLDTSLPQDKKTQTGTFWSSTMQMPPLPYLPFDDVPLLETGPGMFIYDDSKVDYVTLRAEGTKQAAQAASLQGEGGEGGGAMMCMSGGLCLVPKGITNNTLHLTIEGNDPALPYDLYARTNIVGTNAWAYVGRQAAGVTNIAAALVSNDALFFQLGTTYDGDGDGLPDAFEVLVAQLDPNTPNTLQNTPPGNPAVPFLVDVPSYITNKFQEIYQRHLEIWPNGAQPGHINHIRWERGVGGTWTNIAMQKVFPTHPGYATTNLWATWDAAGLSSTSTVANMLYEGEPYPYCNWGYTNFTGISYDHKRTVETKMDLFTGGWPLVSRTNLHVLLVGAQTRTGNDPPQYQSGVSPPYQGGGINMPFQDYTIRGQNPDAGGLVWLILPDNDYFDVTPVAHTNYTNYTFGYTPYKVRLGIFRDNIEIINDTPEIWVGEEAKMDCRLVGAPPDLVLSNFLWTIPGLAISNYYADSQTGRVDTVFSKTNNEVKYYWVALDGGEAEVKVQAVVNGITLHAVAGFRVRRPIASVAAAIHSPVTVDNNFQFQPALHFGNKNAIVGIRFTYTTDYASPPNYDWVQVGMFASRYQDATNGVWYRAGTNGLDTRFTYGQESLYTAADSPVIQLQPWYQACSHGNAFTMYLIFQPPVNNRPKIWVPLRSVVWGWSGQATLSGGNWTLVPDSGSATAGQDAEATAHPTWERNITNYHQLFVPE